MLDNTPNRKSKQPRTPKVGANSIWWTDLAHHQKSVLAALASFENRSSGRCDPSILPCLTTQSGLGKTKVSDVLNELEDMDIIARRGQYDTNGRTSNQYDVHWKRIGELADRDKYKKAKAKRERVRHTDPLSSPHGLTAVRHTDSNLDLDNSDIELEPEFSESESISRPKKNEREKIAREDQELQEIEDYQKQRPKLRSIAPDPTAGKRGYDVDDRTLMRMSSSVNFFRRAYERYGQDKTNPSTYLPKNFDKGSAASIGRACREDGTYYIHDDISLPGVGRGAWLTVLANMSLFYQWAGTQSKGINPVGALDSNIKVSRFLQHGMSPHGGDSDSLGEIMMGQYFHDNYADIVSDLEEQELLTPFVLPHIADPYDDIH